MKKILIPLPSYGFDPTEVAIPWKLLTEKGFEITFLTPKGKQAAADSLMLTGDGLSILSKVLRARNDAVSAYYDMSKSESFRRPSDYTTVYEGDFDALLLPGGHDKAVKEYLESKTLQKLVIDFFKANKPVAAVCHGVVLAARSIDPDTNKSVIYDYKTTALLKKQELLAFNLTRLWLKDYYLTYPGLTTEDEVRFVLSSPNNFKKGPTPLFKDSKKSLRGGFVVKDRNYLSARWPGDVYNLSTEFIKMVKNL